jgi:small subunit ribosomal protein S8
MTMTDPIADMLTRVRNANVAMHDSVRMPSSKVKIALATILEREGYISSFATTEDPVRPGAVLEIQMKYTTERARAIAGLKRVSTPGLRVYARADRLPRVLGGLGVAVLSTSKGLMTDREARMHRMGGEVLCYVW